MTPLQTKQLAFLDETAAHFNSTNRAYDEAEKRCSYKHSFNGGCAIGRKCSPELAESLRDSTVFFCVFKQLPPELQELSRDFLRNVQSLHDDASRWARTGLSGFGIEEYSRIKERITSGYYAAGA